ncbi:excalibur calcium-binding domain-containing protein [Sphingomonas radiodurans]|nr:excalibur calcium-binding domain-containing protein [Sphingomonas radiodurans]WBH18304.1 excalibur calcium-binding domain-containing protein [Sphingomonas radiodurans]
MARRPARQPVSSYGAFRNCAAARAAGAAPLYRGQPGYGAHMDGDGDGIACEPFRRR